MTVLTKAIYTVCNALVLSYLAASSYPPKFCLTSVCLFLNLYPPGILYNPPNSYSNPDSRKTSLLTYSGSLTVPILCFLLHYRQEEVSATSPLECFLIFIDHVHFISINLPLLLLSLFSALGHPISQSALERDKNVRRRRS